MRTEGLVFWEKLGFALFYFTIDLDNLEETLTCPTSRVSPWTRQEKFCSVFKRRDVGFPRAVILCTANRVRTVIKSTWMARKMWQSLRALLFLCLVFIACTAAKKRGSYLRLGSDG